MPCTARMRASCSSIGSSRVALGLPRRNVTTRLLFGSKLNALNGSASIIFRSASTGRMIVGKTRPRCFSIAASTLRSSAATGVAVALKTTLPLESSVLTSSKPARSRARLSSGILQFIGLTPRRKAA